MSTHAATDATPAAPAAFSVVVPAHDEGARLRHVLEALVADAAPGEIDVVVVCNGCSDDTADQARSVDAGASARITVVETPVASKIAALRDGDRLARHFPRIYLDGDTLLTTDAARALAAALRARTGPAAGGMTGRWDLRGCSLPARWYLRFRQRLPVYQGGIIGAGVYAVNGAGRERMGPWPDVTGDDQFVLRSFAPHERVVVTGHSTSLQAPTSLPPLLRRAVRIRRGNEQLRRLAPDGPDGVTGAGAGMRPPPQPLSVSGWQRVAIQSILRPWRWPETVTWLGVQVVARLLAGREGSDDWQPTTPAQPRHPDDDPSQTA